MYNKSLITIHSFNNIPEQSLRDVLNLEITNKSKRIHKREKKQMRKFQCATEQHPITMELLVFSVDTFLFISRSTRYNIGCNSTSDCFVFFRSPTQLQRKIFFIRTASCNEIFVHLHQSVLIFREEKTMR
jgi:hypothetical protein